MSEINWMATKAPRLVMLDIRSISVKTGRFCNVCKRHVAGVPATNPWHSAISEALLIENPDKGRRGTASKVPSSRNPVGAAI
jgi:hypothetical protein